MTILPARVIVSSEVVFRSVGAETVLLDLRGENCFSLDAVGARIWSLLAADPDVSRAVQVLLREYDAGETTVSASLGRLIDELAAAGLVQLDR